MHIAVFQVLHPIHLRATERLGRQYVLAYQEPVLKVLRSGPHRAPSLHEEKFDTPNELLLSVIQKIKLRFYHGFVLVWWSEGFPLLQWIQDQGYPIERQEVRPLGIQLDLPFDEEIFGPRPAFAPLLFRNCYVVSACYRAQKHEKEHTLMVMHLAMKNTRTQPNQRSRSEPSR